MTLKAAQQLLRKSLTEIYEAREAANISFIVMQKLTGLDRSGILANGEIELSETESELFDKYIHELVEYRPVQYVLGETWFAGMKFFVDESVLIPRPETEELVDWAVGWLRKHGNINGKRVIDIGTGSGCIAVSLKKFFPEAEVCAIDISEAALATARKNAEFHNTEINFSLVDIADTESGSALRDFDLVISNPPYIPLTDQSEMNPNVLRYEPHKALFVYSEDPLQFYRQIADYFISSAKPGAALFFETHEQYANEVMQVLRDKGFHHTELKKDMQGKDRMISAFINP